MVRIVCGSILLAGIVFIFGASSDGMAQTRLLEPVGPLVERFTDAVPTLLAGVHWGKLSDKFRTGNLGLQAIKSPRPRNVCVRVASRDSRYRGLAPYLIPPNSESPSRLLFNSQYSDQLEQMPAGAVAVKAIIAGECSDAASGAASVASSSPAPCRRLSRCQSFRVSRFCRSDLSPAYSSKPAYAAFHYSLTNSGFCQPSSIETQTKCGWTPLGRLVLQSDTTEDSISI